MKIMRLLSSLHHDEDERGIFQLSRALVKQGHESLIVASTDPSYGLAKRLERDGILYRQIYLEKQSWLTLISVFSLARLIHQFRPDIIHVHSRTPAWILKWALQMFVPEVHRPITVATIYGYYPVNAYSKAIFDTDHLISVSDSVTENIKLNHPEYDDSSITRIYRGVDNQKFVYRYTPSVYWLRQIFAEYPNLEHKKWLIFPNKIDFGKGQQWLFDIVGNLREFYPNIHIIVMDDESNSNIYFEEFNQRIHALDLTGYFTFIGRREDNREWLSAGNVVLGLSNQPESIGINVLKSIHLGTPVVAWKQGIYCELLKELYPQGLVKEQNAKLLCKVIKSQLQNVGRPQITHEFTLKQTTEQTIKLYEKLLKQGKPNPFTSSPQQKICTKNHE